MEELYTQSFYSKQTTVAVEKGQHVPSPVSNDTEKQLLVETSEIFNQMHFYLDQLEKAIEDEFEAPSDFQFFFSKARDKLKQKTTNGLYKMLADLEQILEVS